MAGKITVDAAKGAAAEAGKAAKAAKAADERAAREAYERAVANNALPEAGMPKPR